MSKRVQFAHSYPNLSSAPANETGRTIFFSKTDGVYAVLADGTVVGPLGSGGAGGSVFATTVEAPAFTTPTGLLYMDDASIALPEGTITASSVSAGGLVAGATGITSDGDISTPGAIWVGGGLTGITYAARFVGSTASGPPTSGTFLASDFVVARDGTAWICTAGGSPGTWDAAGTEIVQQTSAPSSPTSGMLWIDTDAPASVFNPIEPYVLAVSGVLTTQVGKSRIYFENNVEVVSVRAAVGVAPTGASVLIDVNKNGATIYSTQSHRPTIAASGFTGLGGASGIGATYTAATDYLTIDVDQIGSTLPGESLTVTVRMRNT